MNIVLLACSLFDARSRELSPTEGLYLWLVLLLLTTRSATTMISSDYR